MNSDTGLPASRTQRNHVGTFRKKPGQKCSYIYIVHIHNYEVHMLQCVDIWQKHQAENVEGKTNQKNEHSQIAAYGCKVKTNRANNA